MLGHSPIHTRIYVPPEFKETEKHKYPHYNLECFEEWFSRTLNEGTGERLFLDVLFTPYLKNHNYGQDHFAIDRLQRFINALDAATPMFCCIQYDDGAVVDVSRFENLKVFSMSRQYPGSYPLPLIYKIPQPNFFKHKDIFCNFIGRVTHRLRANMLHYLDAKARDNNNKYYISDAHHEPNHFFGLLSRSIFGLCPRGYGPTSFRILECISQGCIPVYISDEFVFPHNLDFSDFGVVIAEKDIPRIYEILESIPESEIKRKQSILPDVYHNYFTYEANKQLILENL